MLYKYRKQIISTIVGVFLLWGIYQLLKPDTSIRIAVVGPMSGKDAANGKSYLDGVKLYVNALNEKNGLDGRKIIVDVYDDENDKDKAKLKAEEIVKKNNVLAVIGHNSSSCSIAAGPLYQANGIPAISPASTNPKVTIGNEWYFRTIFNDLTQGRFLANYTKKVLKEPTFAILHDDKDYGSNLAKVFKETMSDHGQDPEYVWTIKTNNNENPEQELAAIVEDIKSKEYTGLIFLATSPKDGAKFIEKFKDAGLSNRILAPDSFASNAFKESFAKLKKEIQSPGYYSNDVMVTSPLIFDNANEKAQNFKDKYKAAYKAEPDWRAAYAYDSVMVLLDVIHKIPDLKGGKANLKEDRLKVKEALSHLTNIDEAVEGVTGYNYYDENRDSPKPISIGAYKNNDVISSLIQLQAVKNLKEITSIKDALEKETIIKIDNNYLYKTNVVYTGIEINEISKLDVSNLTYHMDFYIWFRFKEDIKPEDIEFLNSIEPITLGEPVDKDSSEHMNYRVYHVKGNFKADNLPVRYELGYHAIGVNFKHKHLTRNNLIYVIDVIGMGMNSKKGDNKKKYQSILSPVSGWMIANFWSFQDTMSRASLGAPKYLNSRDAKAEYSRFNLGVRIRKNEFTIRGFIPGSHAGYYLGFSVLVVVGLGIAGRLKMFQKYSNLNWVITTLFIFLFLIASEIETVDYLLDDLNTYSIKMVTLGFDLLWWIIPAMRLNQAIERFIWDPLEIKTGNKIPTVVRLFLGIFIYILTFFGIVAFVFDQKITSLLATSGVVAMIIGLAIQVNISNVFSGIAINLERPFKVGDWVKIGTLDEGKVIDITWRTTRIQTRNMIILSIPNSKASESPISNFGSKEDITEFWFTIHIDPNENTKRVQKILLDALLSAEGVLKNPAPYTRLNEFTEWSADYIIGYCWKDYGRKNAVRKAVFTSIWTHLYRAGIQPATQRHEIHMFKGVKPRGEKAQSPLAVLQELDIFSSFTEKEKKYLSTHSKTHIFKPGDAIVHTGDTNQSLFVIA
ncbi:MAG TPA: ABC transporter substrate-binding protein, partial [Leptospiraceae bacterium]|nr:ABC transporter substrate-binding protein [Leptospiraceae bacterium]